MSHHVMASSSQSRVLLGGGEPYPPYTTVTGISREPHYLDEFSFVANRLLSQSLYLLILFVVFLYLFKRHTSLVLAPGLLDCQRARYYLPR